MTDISGRRVLDLVELLLGCGLVLLALYLTYGTFRPMETPGHVDGRGFLSHLVVPPVAALGGVIIAHVLPPRLPPERRRIGRYVAVLVFSVLAVIPCVGYVLLFGDVAFSKSPATYRIWFVVALVIGVVVAGITDLRSW